MKCLASNPKFEKFWENRDVKETLVAVNSEDYNDMKVAEILMENIFSWPKFIVKSYPRLLWKLGDEEIVSMLSNPIPANMTDIKKKCSFQSIFKMTFVANFGCNDRKLKK